MSEQEKSANQTNADTFIKEEIAEVDAEKFSDIEQTEEHERPSLASHHRSHHHHHHHHTHRTEHQNTADSIDSDSSTDSISINGTVIDTEADTTSDNKSRERIPLAAHHRSHRHHRSGEHKGVHSSRRRHRSSSIRRRFHRETNKSYTSATTEKISGPITTVEIDIEDFERIRNETINEMKAENSTSEADTLNVDRAGTVYDPGDSFIGEKYQTDVSTDNTKIETYSGFKSGNNKEQDNTENAAPRLASTILAARELKPRATRKASSVKSSGSRQRQVQGARRATAVTIITRILIGVVVLLISGIGVLLYMRARGQSAMTPDRDAVDIVMPEDGIPDGVESVEDDGKTIVYKGEKYRWNDNLSTVLFLGTDRTVEQQESGGERAGRNGQADTILLGVIDNTNKKISFININRDTFIPVAEYTSDGDYAGEKKMQICLSYAYGKDNKTSCQYTAAAVSKYLYGMPIDSYVRLSYDAIPRLNDSIGGVTLTVAEDMTKVDASLSKGATVTLAGNQALTYCRWRDHSIVNTNENRISRQKQFLNAFMKRTIEATRSDFTLPIGLYQNAKPYMTTNITASGVTYMTSKVLEYGIADNAIHGIPGKSVLGPTELVEFNPDQTALYELVLDTFYNKVESKT